MSESFSFEDLDSAKALPGAYEPGAVEKAVFKMWLERKAFAAFPDEREERYVIMMPLPNVTGALHMGHAMDNVMQDLLIRWHRMMGHNSLWMPGTDHAGIATQAVVEKRLFELEGKTRHDVGREALVEKIWEWKDQYQQRIIEQQQDMGCSCDWDRQRFTMDDVCAAAVREAFFRLFRDDLIYRGNRLVNWDCALGTAVSDDEIEYKTIPGHFWHLRYPVKDPQPGEPEYVVVATTRPETMLGDTAVACAPDPEGALKTVIANLEQRLASASAKDRPAVEQELERVRARLDSHLPQLLKLRDMAEQGRTVILPLLNREMPLILDEWAKPELGSGCVKITPAHDPNDYDVWQRHLEEIDIINILNPDGTLNANAGQYADMDRFAARDKVVSDLDADGLLDRVEEHEVELGHSDRSKTPIEPYLSKQWFVRMGDIEGGVVCGRGTDKEFTTPGLAQAAMDAVRGDWRSPSGRKLEFHPDPERYANTYCNWLSEKRDWCISRQLWWGHRIPIWSLACDSADQVRQAAEKLPRDPDVLCVRVVDEAGRAWKRAMIDELPDDTALELQACPRQRDAQEKYEAELEAAGLVRDPDVLDTWFSSALWPHSTLGWPDPENAKILDGQSPTAPAPDRPDTLSYYYPGSCLVTARDIITLWVARMVITGLYNLGDVPFTDCFIHANIQDGKGERMSKSKGNGIDPVDIIERYGADAMRYVLCDMQTGTQDIRLPVQAVSPFTGNLVDLAKAKHGKSIFTYICPESGKEFDVLGTMPDLPAAKVISDRFEIGRNFCNKLWNAGRFALMNLEGYEYGEVAHEQLDYEDEWILTRLADTVADVTARLQEYNPSAAISRAREFFWSDLCDWYIEMIKHRVADAEAAPVARAVLAVALDQILRLLHPFVPFVTEALWRKLNAMAPQRGLGGVLEPSQLLIHAKWPEFSFQPSTDQVQADMELFQAVVSGIRDVRAAYSIGPRKPVGVIVRPAQGSGQGLEKLRDTLMAMAALESLEISESARKPPLAAVKYAGEIEVYVTGVVDPAKEIPRLEKQRKKLDAERERSEKKLANEKFLQKAPAEKVQSERDALKEVLAQIESIDANLEELREHSD